ncbi:1,6-anhydro-N-acetylmuramyl-L-alanine amidase AmpD [Eleftheria terrae]|uniref:1,6-anhydro-N-acetylmuramyl-L-alanine amidase AmpD n=1 Tax=Eleftheria terrae TaxID=1597781 RepID=UPI00263BDF1C|nr:1,6-anhydro-N-acetylmuramyl-L-alanine amidase AmpD [Eleftheria terrae]
MQAGDMLWQDGWFGPARRLPSPNFGPRPAGASIDLVVLHSISLPPGRYGGPEIEQLFTNRLDWDAHPYFDQIRGMEVSAHFVIRRDGELLQFVSCEQRAWHAGRSSFQGRENCNDYSIGVELEGLEDEPFTGPQYACLVPLLQALRQRYPVAHVAGHEHVAPGRKRDPGAAFDWQALVLSLGWPATCFPFAPAGSDVTAAAPAPGDFHRR